MCRVYLKSDFRGGSGQRAHLSDNPSSNPAEVYNFDCVRITWKERKRGCNIPIKVANVNDSAELATPKIVN